MRQVWKLCECPKCYRVDVFLGKNGFCTNCVHYRYKKKMHIIEWYW
jgi:hypothetical protein